MQDAGGVRHILLFFFYRSSEESVGSACGFLGDARRDLAQTTTVILIQRQVGLVGLAGCI